MFKRILLIVTILLVGSLLGDIFFVHHHLDGSGAQADHAPLYFLTAVTLSCLFVVNEGIMAFGSRLSGHTGDKSVRYFCGWHNSAYLEEPLKFSL